MRKLFLIPALMIAITCIIAGQEASDTARLKQFIYQYGQAVVSVEYPGFSKASAIGRDFPIDRYKEGRLYLVINHTTIDKFLAAGITFTVNEPEEGKGVRGSENLNKALEWQSYPSYTQYDSIMRKFAADYPGLCRLDTIGTSVLGKLVLVLKISDNVHIDEYDEPEVFYTSTMHGDELAGFVLMLRLADYLLSNYATDTQVQHLVNNLQIFINPLSNPDGTYRTGNTIVNPIRANANGRDLNRNFPDPLEPGTVQEKENVDMIAFMRSRRFILSANFHSGAEVLNYPWDRWTRFHPDDAWFVRLCRAYADTVHQYSPASYLNDYNNGIVRGSVWYIIYGGRQDFATWELQGREVTIEIDNVKQTPADQLETLWQYNYRSLLNYLGFALNGVRGRVTNASGGEGIAARVFAEGHDTDSSHVYSIAPSGYYNRLIDAGTWAFRFSAQGFRDTVISGIQVMASEPTWLNVSMQPIDNTEDTLRTDRLLAMPNPSNGVFKILLPENSSGEISVELADRLGRTVWRQNVYYQDHTPAVISIQGLSPGVYIIRARLNQAGRLYHGRVVIF